MALWLVPPPGALFPWERAKAALTRIPHLHLEPLDVPALVAAGKALGWSPAVIEHHWRLHESGRCFRFTQDAAPELAGTLYADHVVFVIDDDVDAAAAAAAAALINKLARHLGVHVEER
jgi:hypothetical protein